MEILSFEISGKFAHFRKFFSSSTALSFSIPPRTTIIGILAAILGREKETYYEEFSSDKIRIGIAVKSKLKKTFHRLNHLSIKGPADFRGANLHIQTPFEVISPENIATGLITYNIYLSYFESGETLFNEIKEKLFTNDNIYPISLGIAPFSAKIHNYRLFTEQNIKEVATENEIILFDSAVNSDSVIEIFYNKEYISEFMIEDEIMPADFKSNYTREVMKMNKVLFTDGGNKLEIKFSGKYFKLVDNASAINIQFLE